MIPDPREARVGIIHQIDSSGKRPVFHIAVYRTLLYEPTVTLDQLGRPDLVTPAFQDPIPFMMLLAAVSVSHVGTATPLGERFLQYV